MAQTDGTMLWTQHVLEASQTFNVAKRRKLDTHHNGTPEPNRATTSTPLSHSDYTVGWICALPLEMAAAKAMLDEVHPALPNSPHDHNTYTLGRIGVHTVVIACMPSGVYGTTSAATVANTMLSSFRSIRIGLMVGIGGGAPSPRADIRLGDVVVSKPDGNFTGVVQYDYGKTIQEGQFQRIGTLDKPPYVLLTAASQLQANYRLGSSRILEYLSNIVAKYPTMMPEYVYCDQRPDQLFDAQYDHPDSENSCEHCDRCRLVTRPPRTDNHPVIHYGLIASGNQVMKHGVTRDRWARELGILCFEMEAAGLMDHFPCLVIRGICDYADSHKNKQWQEYAAATAAAYTKEILSVIPRIQITHTPMATPTPSIQLPVAAGAAFDSYQSELDARCHPDTRVDLLREIYDWADDKNGKCIFWLNGMAGTGKSTISRTVAQAFADRGHLGASFFFKRGEHDRENARLFFTTIALDLVRQIPDLAAHIYQAIDKDPAIALKALKEQFEKLIYQPLVDIGPTLPARLILVIDALDECNREGDIRIILSLLASTRRLSSVRVQVFLTSRPELPIHLGFAQIGADTHRDAVLHDIPPSTIRHDISIYLESEFQRIRDEHNCLWPVDQSLTVDWPGQLTLESLIQLSVPLFIVAATISRFIGDPRGDPKDRLNTFLLYLQTGQMSQLENTYLPALCQILVGVDEFAERDKLCQDFRTIVGSIVLLANPLSAISLSRLLQIPKRKIDHQLRLLYSILSVPSDPEAPITLFHLSFREFLAKKNHGDRARPFAINELISHGYLADQCLAVLQGPDGLRQDICQLGDYGTRREEIANATITKYIPPHLQYACRYLVYHLRHSGRTIYDEDVVDDFLRQHFLHWVESLSLTSKVSESVDFIHTLQSLVAEENSLISTFLHDALRFLLTFNPILTQAPLQVYASAWHFSPLQSTVRGVFQNQALQDIRVVRGMPEQWNACLLTLEGHTKWVNSIVFSPDGSRVASGSGDKTVRLWDATTGECQQTLKSHIESVRSVVFSPDGSRVASGSIDKTVRVWNVATGECQHRLEGHTGTVYSVVFSPDGSRVASGSGDKTVCVWYVATGECQYRLKDHTESINSVVFSPDGSRVASGSGDKTVRVWNVATGECQHRLEGHTGTVYSVVFSPDGSRVASGAGSGDKTVRVWDAATGECQHRLEGHTGTIHSVIFSPDGSRVASGAGSGDKTVRVWDVATGECQHRLEGHSNSINSIVFSPDGSRVASGSSDKTVRVWDATTGECQHRLEGHSDSIHSIAFSPDGSRVTSGSSDKTVRVWDAATGECQHKPKGHASYISSVIFSPDGSRVVSGSWDRTVRVWDAVTGECQHRLEGHSDSIHSVAFSPDGSRVASGSYDKTVRVWDAATGECQRRLKGHTGYITSVVFSPDGSRVASGSYDKTVRVWDITTETEILCYDSDTSHSDIKFGDDDSDILVNGQIVSISRRTSNAPTPLSSSTLASNGTLGVTGEWITCTSQRILWLPPEYRPASWASKNDTLIIGSKIGRVILVHRTKQSPSE